MVLVEEFLIFNGNCFGVVRKTLQAFNKDACLFCKKSELLMINSPKSYVSLLRSDAMALYVCGI